MANDDIEGSPSRKRRNIQGFDDETLLRIRPLLSIDYVRVKKMPTADDDGRMRLPKPRLHGSVIVKNRWGTNIVYHCYTDMHRALVHVGKPIDLRGPTGPISAHDTFIISVNFWVSWIGTVITREISRGEIVWDPNQSSYDKPRQQDVLGEYGAVTVGYSVIRRALSVTIDVVWMNESKARISGTVKAVGSSTTRMLFERSVNNWVSVLQPQGSLFHHPGFVCVGTFPFPISVDSYLTIEVDLWDHLSSGNGRLNNRGKQIALGMVHFPPKFGTEKRSIYGKYGEVQVSVTCE